jgi:hypothetical protein
MQFYLSFLDDTVRLPEEQPSIGMILCKIEGSRFHVRRLQVRF